MRDSEQITMALPTQIILFAFFTCLFRHKGHFGIISGPQEREPFSLKTLSLQKTTLQINIDSLI
jgi:hypothetical protein